MKTIKLLIAVFTSLLCFVSTAEAALDTWDTAAPWGATSPTYFAGWDAFDTLPADSTPDVAGSGSGTFTFYVPGAGVFGNGNMYSPPNTTTGAYGISLSANPGGYYNVYVRMESFRADGSSLPTATLIIDDMISEALGLPPNGFVSSQVITYTDTSSGLNESEYYWVWYNIPGSSNYSVFIDQNSPSLYTVTSMAEIAVIPVATPVPEPDIYGMLAAGLGLVGFMARSRKRKENSLN
ncbi:PEP-CTERM sorting domain-containing protein [Methylovorus mays]|uniref:PEP-CTERM sorting domain-containing protein n=1 Tax=Methylovorus mays TaxID=184077 RepID=UPI001E63D380|nr:PEP-CTERM sorting domain-containing protein [Methylovorus mays]MCB5207009.1 PEP-CTERM sorting domain-containing protein [Methylovorus mays]